MSEKLGLVFHIGVSATTLINVFLAVWAYQLESGDETLSGLIHALTAFCMIQVIIIVLETVVFVRIWNEKFKLGDDLVENESSGDDFNLENKE